MKLMKNTHQIAIKETEVQDLIEVEEEDNIEVTTDNKPTKINKIKKKKRKTKVKDLKK